MTDFWTEVAWTVGLSHVLIVVILLHDDPSRLRRWARWLAGCIVPGSAILYAIALVAALTIAPYAEGRFIIRKVSGSVPALPTTNLVVNLAADGDVYNTGTTQCTDGQSVETWVDAAGTAQNATATTGNEPTWFADDGSGNPYVSFDGTEFMSGAATLGDDSCTIYVVGYVTDITAVQYFAQLSDASSTNNYVVLGNTTSPSNGTAFLQVKDNVGSFGTARSSTQLVNSTTAIIHGSNLDPSTNKNVWIDNAGNGTDSTSLSYFNATTDQYSVGAAFHNSAEGNNLTGVIYHVLIYNEEHDASERSDTIAYLQDKWGL